MKITLLPFQIYLHCLLVLKTTSDPSIVRIQRTLISRDPSASYKLFYNSQDTFDNPYKNRRFCKSLNGRCASVYCGKCECKNTDDTFLSYNHGCLVKNDLYQATNGTDNLEYHKFAAIIPTATTATFSQNKCVYLFIPPLLQQHLQFCSAASIWKNNPLNGNMELYSDQTAGNILRANHDDKGVCITCQAFNCFGLDSLRGSVIKLDLHCQSIYGSKVTQTNACFVFKMEGSRSLLYSYNSTTSAPQTGATSTTTTTTTSTTTKTSTSTAPSTTDTTPPHTTPFITSHRPATTVKHTTNSPTTAGKPFTIATMTTHESIQTTRETEPLITEPITSTQKTYAGNPSKIKQEEKPNTLLYITVPCVVALLAIVVVVVFINRRRRSRKTGGGDVSWHHNSSTSSRARINAPENQSHYEIEDEDTLRNGNRYNTYPNDLGHTNGGYRDSNIYQDPNAVLTRENDLYGLSSSPKNAYDEPNLVNLPPENSDNDYKNLTLPYKESYYEGIGGGSSNQRGSTLKRAQNDYYNM
ncbi:uncharacterized protein [Clytia hemisphaerica]|uniref:Cnidarian restricted protein n=1 Tax=Clytia hemisphaerica TaxID=252671 RepID=A0A7M5WXV8_9CNID